MTEYWFYGRLNHVKGHVAIEISEDQTESSAVLPGFSYGDLDRTGNIRSLQVVYFIEFSSIFCRSYSQMCVQDVDVDLSHGNTSLNC